MVKYSERMDNEYFPRGEYNLLFRDIDGVRIYLENDDFRDISADETLSFLQNHPNRFIPDVLSRSWHIALADGNYYQSRGSSLWPRLNEGILFNIRYFYPADIVKSKRRAVKYLKNIVSNCDTLGDKKLLAGVASESFDEALKLALDPSATYDEFHWHDLETQYLNEAAIFRLLQYGFEVNPKMFTQLRGKND